MIVWGAKVEVPSAADSIPVGTKITFTLNVCADWSCKDSSSKEFVNLIYKCPTLTGLLFNTKIGKIVMQEDQTG